jgi:hypothetical protein
VLTLIFMLLIVLVSLTAIIWAVTFFFQGYVYTEPTPGIYWQAPATAALVWFGYVIWVMAIALWPGASPTNIPINTIFRFTPHEDMLDRPAAKIWAVHSDRKKGDENAGESVPYENKRDDRTHFHYKNEKTGALWRGQDVIAIEIEIKDKAKSGEPRKLRFDLTPTDVEEYRSFVSADGWTIREYRNDGPTGLPVRFRFTRLLWNVFFNVAHLVAWFLGLCLILRFQWVHALLLALVMWAAVTLIFLPMMLGYAGEVAAARQQTVVAQIDNLFYFRA